ncbi:hypothetical protein [Propionimicrobium sp. PCR01-08-3]|uniref:hypothetical protein n=1 Tax=Propionimicrobium sp. PCR01-08-3 TaxID=3052086 RepID=UPI00255C9412|nr:hypothetical protein [Propionimicrobium sp. PCR01-08-3]WIY83623.1 hypothetical protein QQ658_04500 [Propionimicrobium sp. PCR01-08-3]
MKAGMYYFARWMTSKSTPVVVTVSPGHLTIASSDTVMYDGPSQQVQVKLGKATGALTLTTPAGKLLIAAMGATNSPAFTPAQIQEIVNAQQVAIKDLQASQLELGRILWIGGTYTDQTAFGPGDIADAIAGPSIGSIAGDARAMMQGFSEAKDQKQAGVIVRDAMVAAGAQSA